MIAENHKQTQTQLVVIHDLHSKIKDTWEAFRKQQHERDEFILKLQTALNLLEKKILDNKAAVKQCVEVVGHYENLLTKITLNQEEMKKIDSRLFAEIKKMPRPPLPLQHVIIGCMFLLGLRFRSSSKARLTPAKRSVNDLWRGCKNYLSESGLQFRLQNIDFVNLALEDVDRTRKFVREHEDSFKKERIRHASLAGVPMVNIVLTTIEMHDLLGGYGGIEKVQQKKEKCLNEIFSLIERRADMNSRLSRLQQISSQLKGERKLSDEDTQEGQTVVQFLAKIDEIVEGENVALDELKRIKGQLADMKRIEQEFKNTYNSVSGNGDLDQVWFAAGKKKDADENQKGGVDWKDAVQVN